MYLTVVCMLNSLAIIIIAVACIQNSLAIKKIVKK